MLIVLGVDKAENVGVSDSHHSHIRAAANTALFHDIGYLIDDVHERNGPGGCTVSQADSGASGAQGLVSHAGAAAGLMNHRGNLGMVHDAGNGVGNSENKASGKLAIVAAGIYEAGSVRQKLAVEHDLSHCLMELVMLRLVRFGP